MESALVIKSGIFFLTAASAASGQACDSGGWDVTPSEAYTWGYQPPQGCTCQEAGVSLVDCEASCWRMRILEKCGLAQEAVRPRSNSKIQQAQNVVWI